MKKEEILQDLECLGVEPGAAEAASAALAAALDQPALVNPLAVPYATAEALGALVPPDTRPSAVFKDAAGALEWGSEYSPEWGLLGLLPRAGGWSSEGLPREIPRTHFVWTRVHTEGTGNGGRWAPAKPRTEAARAILRWFTAQSTVKFYGGYWWEAVDRWGFGTLDEIASRVRDARERGYRYPQSCREAARIDGRLAVLSGPRMWALVSAAAGTDWPGWADSPRARRNACLLDAVKGIEGVTYTPAP